jgi:hypothetical protein
MEKGDLTGGMKKVERKGEDKREKGKEMEKGNQEKDKEEEEINENYIL